LGVGIGLASLQDSQKIHLRFENNIIENTEKAKMFLLIISTCTVLMLLFGMFGFFLNDNKYINEISLGILILGISFIGLLKFQLELVELHNNSPELKDHIAESNE